jgi:hypothetical protein
MVCAHCAWNNLDTSEVCARCGNLLKAANVPSPARPSSAIPLVPPRPPAAPPPPAEAPNGSLQGEGHRDQSTAPPPPPRPQQPAAPPLPGWNAPGASALFQRTAPGPGPALPQFGSLAAAPGYAGQVTCGVCGAAIYPGQPLCARCQTPYGAIVNPNDPTASNFLPFGPPVPLTPLFRAGEERLADRRDLLRGWNWGAALLPTVWAARHRLIWPASVSGFLTLLLIGLYLARAALLRTADAGGTLTGFLVVCVLLFGVPRSLYAGIRGNTAALRSGLYPDRDSLRKGQRTFTLWAIIGVIVLAFLLGGAAALLAAR